MEGRHAVRSFAILLLLLTACDGQPQTNERAVEARPAAVSFDGGDYHGEAARVAHGERLADVLGCTGCHGDNLQGKLWFENAEQGLLHASNLTRALQRYSDADIEKMLRAGEHPSGRDVWGMPSELFQHLADADMAALIAYLRTFEPAGEPSPEPVLGPVAKQAVAKGELKPTADWVRDTRNKTPIDLGPRHALARYIAKATCAECHGSKLEGDGKTPDLIVVGAYTREEFERLITEGVPTGGRKLHPLMVGVSKDRFSKLTPRERDALYAYLKDRAERPQ